MESTGCLLCTEQVINLEHNQSEGTVSISKFESRHSVLVEHVAFKHASLNSTDRAWESAGTGFPPCGIILTYETTKNNELFNLTERDTFSIAGTVFMSLIVHLQ